MGTKAERSLTCPNDERREKLETLLEFFSEKVTQKMEEDKAFDQDTRFRARLYTPRYQVEKNCISPKTYNNLTKMVSGFFEFAEASLNLLKHSFVLKMRHLNT